MEFTTIAGIVENQQFDMLRALQSTADTKTAECIEEFIQLQASLRIETDRNKINEYIDRIRELIIRVGKKGSTVHTVAVKNTIVDRLMRLMEHLLAKPDVEKDIYTIGFKVSHDYFGDSPVKYELVRDLFNLVVQDFLADMWNKLPPDEDEDFILSANALECLLKRGNIDIRFVVFKYRTDEANVIDTIYLFDEERDMLTPTEF